MRRQFPIRALRLELELASFAHLHRRCRVLILPARQTIVALSFALGIVPATVVAQVAYDSPSGRVEVLGLHHWTLKMLQDSVASRRAGQRLDDAACMVLLRNELHFADASVDYLTFPGAAPSASKDWIVIKVTEPQDSARASWLPIPPLRSKSEASAYPKLMPLLVDSAGDLLPARVFPAIQRYRMPAAARDALLSRVPVAERAAYEALWPFLDRQRRAPVARIAEVLATGVQRDRVIAASALAVHDEDDRSWHLLINALRDSDPVVRVAAQVALQSMPPRTIAWDDDVRSLRLLLGGTNAGATEPLLEILLRTNIRPSLAAALLRGNADWILMHAHAENPRSSAVARAFLVHANNGVDLGSDAAWRKWAAAGPTRMPHSGPTPLRGIL